MHAAASRGTWKATAALLFLICIPALLSAQNRIRLATTTSTEQSGLLAVLLPAFERSGGYIVDVIAVGTGAALKLGERGDADILLVHARALEDAFMAAGYGDERRDIFYNDFIILGAPEDPARISAAEDGPRAFSRIARSGAPFVSRGDASGTHAKELELWKAAGTVPEGSWYKEAGQGMSQTIMMADQMRCYTLADRATWLATADKTSLRILHQGSAALSNPYGVITVSARRHPAVNSAGAKALMEWMGGPEARSLTAGFKIRGEPCFFLY